MALPLLTKDSLSFLISQPEIFSEEGGDGRVLFDLLGHNNKKKN